MAFFKDRLISLRREREMNQEELAKEIGVSKSAVSMYENGNRTPSFEIEEKIADLFNVDLEYLRGRSDIKNKSYLEYFYERDLEEALEELKDLDLNVEKLNQYGDYLILDKNDNELACMHETAIVDLFVRNNKTFKISDFIKENEKVVNQSPRFRWVARNAKKMTDEDLLKLQNLMKAAFEKIDFDEEE